MSSDWPEVRVEEIAAGDSNALSTGPFGSAIGSRFFASSGVPVIRGSNLSADVGVKLIDENLVFVSLDKAKEFRRSIAKRGDLVFTCWGTINQIGLIHERSRYPEYVVSNKQMKLTVDPKKVDSKFLYYVFSSPEKQQEILSNGIGAAVPGFNLGQLKRHAFRLPPLDVQQGVVRVLDSLDAKIDVNRRINQTLEAIAQAIFKSWFVDFGPVKAKIAAKAEGRDPLRAAMTAISGKPEAELDTLPPDQFAPLAATAALFPDEMEDSELGEIPKGWGAMSFSELAEVIMGQSPNGESYNDIGDGAALINGPVEFDSFHPKRVKWTTQPTKFCRAGDLIACVRGSTTGRYIKSDGIYCLGRGVCAFRAHESRWQPYVDQTYKFSLSALLSLTTGSTFPSWSGPTLKSYRVLRPAPGVIDAFSALLLPMTVQLSNIEHQIKSLASVRDALLPKLLSGALPVASREVEAIA